MVEETTFFCSARPMMSTKSNVDERSKSAILIGSASRGTLIWETERAKLHQGSKSSGAVEREAFRFGATWLKWASTYRGISSKLERKQSSTTSWCFSAQLTTYRSEGKSNLSKRINLGLVFGSSKRCRTLCSSHYYLCDCTGSN